MSMSTRARARRVAAPVERKIKDLGREVQILRSGLISLLGEDLEGEYRPKFVQEILRAAAESPTDRFSDARRFRAALRKR